MDWRGLPVGGGPPEIKRGPKETHSGWPTPYCIIREKQREVESYRQWHRHFFDFVDHEALPDGPFGEKRLNLYHFM